MVPKPRGVDTFKVSEWGEFSSQSFVRQYAGLGESSYCSSHLNIYKTLVHMCGQVILFDDPTGEQFQWDAHVFKILQRRGEVKNFDI